VLNPLGIDVAHELKGVGENLQDHLQIRCAYKVSGVKTMNERYQSLAQRAGFAAQYVLTRRGPMTMAPSQLGAFVKSDASRETPNLQYHIQPLTLPKFGEPLDPFPAFTASVANIRPTSRGWVRIAAPDPVAHPEIRPNYLSTAEDRHVAAEAIRVTRRIAPMPALAKYRPEEFRPGLSLGARRSWRRPPATFHHHLPPRGTAKMGNDETAVVDPGLRVCGLQACGSPTPL
jgi:choline dehydrogenase-like flavoprotein